MLKKRKEVRLCIPFPPSVNTYYSTVRGRRVLTKKGRLYKEWVTQSILCQEKISTLTGRIALYASLHPPDNRRRDIDNFLKSLLDALGQAGVYDDDSQIDELHIRRGEKIESGAAFVTCRELIT